MVLIIVGKGESGKSTLIEGDDRFDGLAGKGIVTQVDSPVFVVDTVGQFNKGMAFETAEHIRMFLIQAMRGKVTNPGGIYVLRPMESAEVGRLFKVLHEARVPGTLVIDEAHRFAGRHSMDPHLKEIILVGRNWGMDIVAATRRWQNLNNDLTSEAQAVITFRMKEPSDVQKMKRYDPAAERLPKLGDHEFIVLGRKEALPFAESIL